MKSLRQIAAMFTPFGWTILAVAVLSILLALFFLITEPQRARGEAAAKAGVVLAQGEKKASTDAISVVVGNQERSEETQNIRRENEVAIREADGAGDEVNPAVAAAGRNGLCKYRAYRDRPECVRKPNP